MSAMLPGPLPGPLSSESDPAPMARAKRPPPTLANIDAEQAVLGAMYLDVDAINAVRAGATKLDPADFYLAGHGEIFAAMLELRDGDEAIDPLTLAETLRRRGQLEAAGGKTYLGYLIDAVPSAHAIAHHAAIVRRCAARRRAVAIGRDLIAQVQDPERPLEAVLAETQGALLPLTTGDETRGFRSVRESVWPVMEAIEARSLAARAGEPVGVPTGLPELDDLIGGGFRPGELAIFGSAPKMGKTTTTTTILLHNARAGRRVGVVSAEMTREELTQGWLSALSEVPRHRLDSGRLWDDDFPRLARWAGVLANLPIEIDDEAYPSLGDVTARAMRLKAEFPDLALLLVDYLQLVSNPLKGRRGDEELNAVSRGLKALAKRLRIPILAPVQVNYKETDGREDKRPTPRDIQGFSGAAQDGNFLFLLYRPREHSADPRVPDVVEVELALSRRTPKGRAVLGWDGACMRVLSQRRTADPGTPAGGPPLARVA